MGRLAKATLILSVPAIAAGYYLNKVYTGPYLEQNPFNDSKYSLLQKIKYKTIGSNDNAIYSKSAKIANPNRNPSAFDFYEYTLDKETSAKVLAKYKTNEELLKVLEKGYFQGPTLWFHQYILTPYFKSKGAFNRIAGFTAFEPELKKLDVSKLPKTAIFGFPLLPENKKLKYVWNGSEIDAQKGLLPVNTIVYGLFDVVDYGKRTNGGYYDVTFGSDLLDATMVHRLEYEVINNEKNEENLLFRFVNVGHLIAPTKQVFTDGTKGLHELMTRTIVHDVVREATRNL